MKPNRLIAFALIAAGTQAALQTLTRRTRWEAENKRVQIVADYADVGAVSIRAGMGRPELFTKLREHGVTHVSLPELSLARLMNTGRVMPILPRTARSTPPPVGEWMYLSTTEPALTELIVTELKARVPQIQAEYDPSDPCAFAYAGDLETIGEMGLGFETWRAQEIHDAGLGVVPRPMSYAWADQPLIDRTLKQAAELGNGNPVTVAFDGDLIVGHEMHLKETVNALACNNLTYAYFAESRHQRGDWFIAKSRMPHVILADRMTPAQMIPEDFHSAAHRWAMLVRERGIRLLYVNFFRIVHATDPLECLHYVEHIVEAVTEDGFTVTAETPALPSLNVPQRETIQTGWIAAGTAALAVNEALDVPEPLATGLTIAGAAVPFALQLLDKPRNELERTYAPSYLPKLLALTTALAAPIAGTRLAAEGGLEGLLAGGIIDATSAASLSALTTSADYQLRVEEYRGYDLDLWLPLLAAALELRDLRLRWGAIAAGMVGWFALRQRAPDLLGQLDRAHASSHTHHLSTSGRIIGDLKLQLGPRPARKWAWLAPFAAALVNYFNAHGESNRAALAISASTLGRELMLVGFRKPERDVMLTAQGTVPSYAVGKALALAVNLITALAQ